MNGNKFSGFVYIFIQIALCIPFEMINITFFLEVNAISWIRVHFYYGDEKNNTPLAKTIYILRSILFVVLSNYLN